MVLTYPRLIGRDGCDGAFIAGLGSAVVWPLVALRSSEWQPAIPVILPALVPAMCRWR